MNQKIHFACVFAEPPDNARHQVPNYDEITNANSETFDGNGGIKENRGIWIGDLREGKER